MNRGVQSALFAAFLLVAQLLFATMPNKAMSHDGDRHCGSCPDGDSSEIVLGLSKHASSPSGGVDTLSSCGSHCDSSHRSGGPPVSPCGPNCVMLGGGHCASPPSLAVAVTVSLPLTVVTDTYGSDRRPIELPESPLFDFLRPPNRA